MKGSTAEESIAEASRGNDTIEAEAWAERTSVITSFDHEIHCALARDFVEDIVDKVIQQAEGSRSFGEEPRSSPLPDILKDSQVDESDESEYESADETIVDIKKAPANATFDLTDSDDLSLRLELTNETIDVEDSPASSAFKAAAVDTTIVLDKTIDLDSGNEIHYESVLEDSPSETGKEGPPGEVPVLSEQVKSDEVCPAGGETAPREVPAVPEESTQAKLLPQEEGVVPGVASDLLAEVLEVPISIADEIQVPVEDTVVPVLPVDESPIPGEDREVTQVSESSVNQTEASGENTGAPGEDSSVPEPSVSEIEAPGENTILPEEVEEDQGVPDSTVNQAASVIPGESTVVCEENTFVPGSPVEQADVQSVPVRFEEETKFSGEALVPSVEASGKVPGVPEPSQEDTKTVEEILNVPELTAEETLDLDRVPVVPESSSEETKTLQEVPVVPETFQELISSDDIPLPKKGYDLSFLDNLEDLENVSPDAIFGTKTASKAPSKKPVIKKRVPQPKKDPAVPKRPEVPAEPVLEEKKDLEKEVLEQELILPKKGYDLSFLDKLEDLENAAPDALNPKGETNEDLAMKETKESEPPVDQNASADKAPASKTETKARINNRRIVKPRPVVTRPVDTEAATEEFNADENPFKPKNKLAASPTSTTQSFDIVTKEEQDLDLLPRENEAVDKEEETLQVLEPVTNEPAPVFDLSAETFRPAAEILNDPAEMDFLLKFGGSSNAIALARQSLFANFDPLIAGRPSLFPANTNSDASLMEETQINESVNNGDSLFVFSPPHPSAAPSSAPSTAAAAVTALQPAAETDLSNTHLKEALKMQELLFQDRLLQKDRELINKEKELTDMKAKLETATEAQTQMKQILGEYEKTISQLIAEKEREKATMEAELQKAVKEKDQATEDIKEVERAFSEFHRMYERTKAAAEGLHKNEEALKKAVAAYQERLQLEQQKYETLKLHASQKLESAQQETENIKRGFEAESARMKALLKKTEMRLASVESTLEQRNKENEELTKLCDELINRLGAANN